MEDLQGTAKYLKKLISPEELKIIAFLEKCEILDYSIKTEKVKDGDKVVEKPTNKINIDFLKICTQEGFQQNDLLGLCFLRYFGFSLKNYKLYWNVTVDPIEKDLKNMCSYCTVKLNKCPFKVLGIIKKLAEERNLSEADLFRELANEPPVEKTYKNDPDDIKELAEKTFNITNSIVDFGGIEFYIETGAVTIEKIENGKIYYRELDFNAKNKSLINNIKEYVNGGGISGEVSIDNPNFEKNYSYMFDVSPAKLAVFFKYWCDEKNIDEEKVMEKIEEKTNTREKLGKMAFFKEYLERVYALPIPENTKLEIKEMFEYVKNYYYSTTIPYIKFNTVLYSSNYSLCEEIQKLILNFFSTFGYSGNINWIRMDVNTFIRKSKDSIDVMNQIDRMYFDNDFVIFYNFDGLKTLNELRVESFFAAVEKYCDSSAKTTSIFITEKEVFNELIANRKTFRKNVICKELEVNDYSVEYVKSEVKRKLNDIFEYGEEQEKKIDLYIENKFSFNERNGKEYIDEIFKDIVYNEFKVPQEYLLTKDKTNASKLPITELNLPEIDSARDVDKILEDINNLVGLPEIKSTVSELIKYLEYSKKIDTNGFVNLNMVFKGNSGTGKSTMARLLTELLFKLNFIKRNKIVEITSRDLIGEYIGQTPQKTQKAIESALGGILFIDNANNIMSAKGNTSNYASECISTIISAMESHKDDLVIIFSGEPMEMNNFLIKNQSIASRIGYELEFTDFTTSELLKIFEMEAEKNGFTLNENIKPRIENIINKNKIGRNFGNARFVISLFNSLVLTHSSCYENDEELKLLSAKDVEKYEETKKNSVRSIDDILQDLNSLIGLADVKEVINGFVALMEFNKKLEKPTDLNMHMIFKGNAGTGKTTVARLLAEIYFNLGYAKKNKLIEVQSKDLIGEFVGQTGPKTQAIINSAVDGVLFVDEAYAIMGHKGSNGSFTDECIATFLKAMEDYQGRLIIIFAGYTEEMRTFRDLNPGLKSRVGFEIDFQDYSVEELLRIWDKKLAEKELRQTEGARNKIKEILEKAKEVDNFGNGRFVDTTLQKVIVEHAIRTRNINDINELTEITEEDVKNIKAEESKRRIGF